LKNPSASFAEALSRDGTVVSVSAITLANPDAIKGARIAALPTRGGEPAYRNFGIHSKAGGDDAQLSVDSGRPARRVIRQGAAAEFVKQLLTQLGSAF
jgi:hypothetical protein